jgi:hypothetical protein
MKLLRGAVVGDPEELVHQILAAREQGGAHDIDDDVAVIVLRVEDPL